MRNKALQAFDTALVKANIPARLCPQYETLRKLLADQTMVGSNLAKYKQQLGAIIQRSVLALSSINTVLDAHPNHPVCQLVNHILAQKVSANTRTQSLILFSKFDTSPAGSLRNCSDKRHVFTTWLAEQMSPEGELRIILQGFPSKPSASTLFDRGKGLVAQFLQVLANEVREIQMPCP